MSEAIDVDADMQRTSTSARPLQLVKVFKPSHPVQVLILGAGWTSTFLIPLLEAENVTFAATTRAGSPTTIPFAFDPESNDREPYECLPSASFVIITFPIKGLGPSKTLTSLYTQTHPAIRSRFIQLGSTGIWTEKGFSNRRSPPDLTNQRCIAENELLSLGHAVINLAGLWGGERNPKNWVGRIAPTREALAKKDSVHMIHGIDVAYAILALIRRFTPGERWLLTDMRVYDWWDLASAWGDGGVTATERVGKQPAWVLELMIEKGVRCLPRSMETLGRVLDSTEFWIRFGLMPVKPLNY